MDILVELPVAQWPKLQEKLKTMWPTNLPGYYSLQVNFKHPTVREAFDFKVYCPYGDMDNGFVGIYIKGHIDVIVFSITEDTSKLEKAILKTSLIDWNKTVIFNLVSSIMVPTVNRIRAVMQWENVELRPSKVFVLDKNTKTLPDMRLPAGTYVAQVKPEYIKQVDNAWHYPNSHKNFAAFASSGLSYGLYSSDTNELLAWVFLNEFQYLLHLYCEEKHRKRGYAEYIMYCAAKDAINKGNDLYAYVVGGNQKPLKIFYKFGFKVVDDSCFVILKHANKKIISML